MSAPLEVRARARPEDVRVLRDAASAYAVKAGATADVVFAVRLAVSELATNAVLHAYDGDDGPLTLRARAEGAGLVVEVVDAGRGIAPRTDSPGTGLGLLTVGRLAQGLAVGPGSDGAGTTVVARFALNAREPTLVPADREALDAALRRLVPAHADVATIDASSGGVLRRLRARVHGDDHLTAWLSMSAPPAKPGTSTWEVLRGRPSQLVLHDPTVPRTPGGPGETLGLGWWLACALTGEDGLRGILGVGGRDGRPAPDARDVAAVESAAATLSGALA